MRHQDPAETLNKDIISHFVLRLVYCRTYVWHSCTYIAYPYAWWFVLCFDQLIEKLYLYHLVGKNCVGGFSPWRRHSFGTVFGLRVLIHRWLPLYTLNCSQLEKKYVLIIICSTLSFQRLLMSDFRLPYKALPHSEFEVCIWILIELFWALGSWCFTVMKILLACFRLWKTS